MNNSLIENIIETGNDMAQDLQEYIAAGEKAGSIMKVSIDLIKDYELAVKKVTDFLEKEANDKNKVSCPNCQSTEVEDVHNKDATEGFSMLYKQCDNCSFQWDHQ